MKKIQQLRTTTLPVLMMMMIMMLDQVVPACAQHFFLIGH